jgi:hypothetical protein
MFEKSAKFPEFEEVADFSVFWFVEMPRKSKF